MLEKVARVARVKGTDCDVNSPFLRKNSRDDQQKDKSPFQKMLSEKIRQEQPSAPVSEAYVMDCTRATQSLFYQQGVDLRFFNGSLI